MEDFCGKSKEKSTEILKLRWKENIKMDFREIFRDGVNWILLAEDKENGEFCEDGN
jgi:hypothetical protein